MSAFVYFGCFVVLPQSAGKFDFADAGGAEEDEGADGAFGILEARAGADDGVGDGLHGFVLADDALVENLVEAQELFLLKHLLPEPLQPR